MHVDARARENIDCNIKQRTSDRIRARCTWRACDSPVALRTRDARRLWRVVRVHGENSKGTTGKLCVLRAHEACSKCIKPYEFSSPETTGEYQNDVVKTDEFFFPKQSRLCVNDFRPFWTRFFQLLFSCFRYDRTYWATVLHQILRYARWSRRWNYSPIAKTVLWFWTSKRKVVNDPRRTDYWSIQWYCHQMLHKIQCSIVAQYVLS